MWAAILVTAAGCYLLKLVGLSVPQSVLSHRAVRRVADLMPVALLAALVGTQTFGDGASLSLDAARVAGLLAGVAALLLRASFIVVVAVAAVTSAVLRLLAG